MHKLMVRKCETFHITACSLNLSYVLILYSYIYEHQAGKVIKLMKIGLL